MYPIKQYPKVKKSEISENIFLYLDFTQHQTLTPKIFRQKKDTGTQKMCYSVNNFINSLNSVSTNILPSAFVLIG